jgi:hypothetical protein
VREIVEVLDNPCLLRAVVIDCRGVADVQLHLEVDLVAHVHLHLAVILDDQIRQTLEDGAADRQVVLAEDRAVLEARKHHSCCDVVAL